MKNLISQSFNLLSVFLVGTAAPVWGAESLPAGPRIEIVETPVPAISKGMPVLPRVATEDVTWKHGEPSFTIMDGTAVKARGWTALSENSILMKVVVADETHANHRAEGEIWDGDCIQIGIDSRGTGVGSQSSLLCL